MYRTPAERESYEEEEPKVALRSRAASFINALAKGGKLPGFLTTLAFSLITLALFEAGGFLFFCYDPLTSGGQPASLTLQLIMAPMVSFMIALVLVLAIGFVVYFRRLVRFAYSELSEIGDDILRKVARKLDKNVD